MDTIKVFFSGRKLVTDGRQKGKFQVYSSTWEWISMMGCERVE